VREKIISPRLSNEFYTDEKCYILESSNSNSDEALSIARARVVPGVTTNWHRLKRQIERYYIVSGEGKVEVGELEPTHVKEGDVVIIPPMCKQRITNTGTNDLVFLAMCTPRFTPDDYEDLENQE
jgi:mannose-6-phosphate isomerase-like protein (cupin superfamily)